MATNRDLITDTARMVFLASDEELSAADASSIMGHLNDIGFGFDAESIYAGWSEFGLDDEVWLEEKHHGTLKALLAVRIAPLFKVPVDPRIEAVAIKGRQLLRADYMAKAKISDDSVRYMPSQRWYR